jgi:hypothetical protein
MLETRKQLPQFVRDLLASPPAIGNGMNAWLFRVARVMHPYRDRTEIVATLAASVADQPVAMLDIERAVKNSKDCAWSPESPLPAPRPQAWPAVNLEQREAITATGGGLADIWEASPVKWETSQNQAEGIIDSLFPGNPLLCVGKSSREFATRSRSKWQGRLSAMQLIVPSPMTSRTGITKEGKESEHTLSNTGPRQFLVIEQDQGTPDEQAAILLHLSKMGPLVLAAHSGSKSLHGWFACLGRPDEELRAFMNHAVTLGADPATWTRSQFVRMPDGTRDNGKRQRVFYFNPFLLPTTGGRTNKNERTGFPRKTRSFATNQTSEHETTD